MVTSSTLPYFLVAMVADAQTYFIGHHGNQCTIPFYWCYGNLSRSLLSPLPPPLLTCTDRNFFHDKNNTNPVAVAKMVEYIRAQVLHMDSTDSHQLLREGEMKFLPPTVS